MYLNFEGFWIAESLIIPFLIKLQLLFNSCNVQLMLTL